MSGHSLGAFTTLLLGGMGVDCKVPLTPGQLNLRNPIITDINPCAEPKVKALRRPTALSDRRIKAMIALAPPFFSLTDQQIAAGASDVGIPTMVITGRGSTFESTLAPQVETFDGIHSAKYLVEVKGVSHLLVSDDYQFNPVLSQSLPTSDKANFKAKARVYEDYSVAFFNRYLKGEQLRTAATLDHPTSSFVAVLRHRHG
jgi:predicted dienelactone hydrolase